MGWHGPGDLQRRHRGDPRKITRDAATRRVDELRRAAEADGIELALIAGNHDPVVSEHDWLTLADDRIVLTHGDLLHPAIAPWSDEDGVLRRLRDQEVGRTLDRQNESPLDLSLEEQAEATKRAAARHWRLERQQDYEQRNRSWLGRRVRQARTLGKVLYYWTEMPRRAQRFADQHFPQSRFFIFGHIHRPGVWIDPHPAFGDTEGLDSAQRVVINTGSFHQPCRPRAVTIDAEGVAYWKIKPDTKNGHRLAGRPARRFDLRGQELEL